MDIGETFQISYRRQHLPALFNESGFGNTRFSPLPAGGRLVPTMYGAATQPVALLWQSRLAELARADSLLLGDLLGVASDVFVLFGDRLPVDGALWSPGDPHYADLKTGGGRLLAEQIAEQLGAVIVPN